MDHCPEHSAHDRAIRDHDKQFEKTDKQFEEADRQFAATGERIDALENVPADRWNKVVDYALTCVLGIAIGFMASNIGL